jgi:hypothetical protein
VNAIRPFRGDVPRQHCQVNLACSSSPANTRLHAWTTTKCNVNPAPWCFVAAANALKEDSIIGDAPQIVMTAQGAEGLVHPHAERPQCHTDLELVAVKYQPWMNVYQHSHFPEHSTPAVSETTGVCSP